jgi:3-phenylpropionate/cinnamic acid dioxygenase small subunit
MESDMTEQERVQLRQLLAREEMTQVLHDFARAVDELDFTAMVQCFTPELRWDYGPGAGVVIETRDDLLRFVTEAFTPDHEVSADSLSLVRIKKTSHHVSNVRIDIEGDDTARSEAYVFTWHEMPDNRPGLVWGKWHDRWRHTEEGWRICERKMIVSATDNYYAIGYDAWTGEPLSKPDPTDRATT